MNEITNEQIEISEEQKAIEEEVNEIQEENPNMREIIDIMKRETYKELLLALNRSTIKIEITNLDKISLGPGPEKSSPGTTNEEWIVQDLDQVMILQELDKSYLVVKNGYSTVVAYSHLTSRDSIKVGTLMNLNDLVKTDRKWILKTKKTGEPNLEWKEFTNE